ncbi:M23 family metallopeptidase [Lysobacter arvi]|uniref:M23 family metallopeptidase n=1 Tax=Lysobacter arvi TaxID=3038776 RepID=A0ABU1CG76_9GAMM|nr:M23 family metallopeptidase [Lysobacter arvi]MDR0183940.1 M23 family metallopeptidase [Lysobacter arvi]
MPPAVRKPRVRPIRCGWRSSLQVLCATAVFIAASSGGSKWTRSHAVRQADAVAVETATGGPYLPAAQSPHYDLVADLARKDAAPLRAADDAVELSALGWNPVKRDWHERLLSLLPVAPVRITSGFGRRHDPFGRGDAFHSGIDFAGSVGTPVHACGDGVVVQARYSKDYGNVVMIDHGQGIVTLYAHNSRLEVRPGDVVLAGQEISKMGSTGRSTGPHLHFEVRQYGRRIDPGRYLAGL